jgi:hypothetical protein
MSARSCRSRALSSLLVGLTLLAACSPPQRIYSIDPVDPRGASLPLNRAVRLRLETGEESAVPDSLRLSDGRIHCSDGRSWPLASIDWIDFRGAGESQRRIHVESPEDLLGIEKLPRILSVQLRDGRRIELDQDNDWSRWSEDRLALELSMDGVEYERLAIEDLHTVRLYDGSLVRDSLGSWKFWLVAGGATALIWVVSTRSEDNLAVR